MAELNSAPEKSGGRRATRRTPARVDLTAMVDLAFLLITFFMLTTILSKPKALPLAMPTGPAGPVPETGTMTVCLGKSNQVVWYMGMPAKPLTTPAQTGYGKGLTAVITEKLTEVFKRTGKGLMVVIKPSDHSNYANLVETIDELNNSQVHTYAIAKISPEDVGFLKNKGLY
jgi:biopolymer transport protein ExbD